MLGLGLSITIGSSTPLPQYLKDYIDRVAQDGGLVEAISCVRRAVNALPEANEGRLIFEAYDVRVVADLGLTEARDCTITEINNLL